MTNDQANYYLGITNITVNGKNAYELKGKFLDDLHKNAFSGTNEEDAVEHIDYFLKIVDPIDLPNVNQDKLRVVVFSISLVGDAWRWFDGIKGSVTSIRSGLPVAGKKKDIDSKLKEEALRNKAIMEGMIDDNDESSNNGLHYKKIRDNQVFIRIRKEYVAVKEDEYEDLKSTSKDACRAYQEIFRMMDEGWMVTRME
ncbi:hypothetical protein Tco_1030295 [Tanacetum coccineum]|uniref:Retrotransposon gag domain-containing protein n=1 Tax=Tanacetum coccineum TaxID=301880 RepID=A0ABQ5G6H5_9ASTR